MIVRYLFIIMLLFVGCVYTQQPIVIENPGISGINSFYGDNNINLNEARQLVNLDTDDGDLVKRAGISVVYIGSDTLNDGVASFYDVSGDATLFKVSYDNDTGKILYSNENSYTFSADSAIGMYPYKSPIFGYDWVNYENTIIGANGENQPVMYQKGQWGTLSIPTPGAPMVAPLNVVGNLTGTYSYKLHYFQAAGDTTDKSEAGAMTTYTFNEGSKNVLFAFPERCDSLGNIKTARYLITRTKAGGSDYYVLDTITFDSTKDSIYIDNIADASLGDKILVGDTAGYNCCSDTMPIPGQPYGHTPTAGSLPWSGYTLGSKANLDTFHFAYSYVDTNLGIESEIGAWEERASDDSGSFFMGVRIPPDLRNFVDAIVVYCDYDIDTTFSDTSTYRIFDTIRDTGVFGSGDSIGSCAWTPVGDYWCPTPIGWHEGFFETCVDSFTFFSRNKNLPFKLTNKLPYKYLEYSFSRLWGAGDVDFPSRLYYSGRTDLGSIGHWDFAFDYIALDENDGDKILGMTAIDQGLIVYKGYSTWFITGTDPNYNMRAEKISSTYGAASNNSIVHYNGIDVFLSPLGYICIRSGTKIQPVSQRIHDSFSGKNMVDLSTSTANIFDGDYWLSFQDSTANSTGTIITRLDTVYLCDLMTGNYEWRKYDLQFAYSTFYDTTSVDYTPKKQSMIFSKDNTDSLFQFDIGTTDNTDSIRAIYISPPFLTDANYRVYGGKIEAEIPYQDSIYITLQNINNDSLAFCVIHNDSTIIQNNYDFYFDSPIAAGFHLRLDDRGSCSSLRIKRITIDYDMESGVIK